MQPLIWIAALGAVLTSCSAGPAPRGTTAPARGAYCDVTVRNGTSHVLNVSYGTGSPGRSLGSMSPGESMDVSVPCEARRVYASGVSSVVSPGSGRLSFHRTMELNVSGITRLTLRGSDVQR